MITSTSNSKVKNVMHLNTSSKARREQKLFVVEGIKMFMEAPSCSVAEVFVSEEYIDRLQNTNNGNKRNKAVLDKLNEVGYEIVSDECFKKMSDTVTPQGVLSVIRKKEYDLGELINKKERLRILILDGIQDPGNLGTMVRTAEGAGYDLVLASSNTVDIYNPKVIRSTMGSIYRVPMVYVTDLVKEINQLKAVGVKLYAAHLKGRNNYYDEFYDDKTGIMIGNEGNGLSDEIANMSDVYIKIPMAGQVESLNASVAAAILMYESVK